MVDGWTERDNGWTRRGIVDGQTEREDNGVRENSGQTDGEKDDRLMGREMVGGRDGGWTDRERWWEGEMVDGQRERDIDRGENGG